MTLQGKTLTQLRGLAQSLDIADIFQKDPTQLIQAIEQKQQDMLPKPKVEIPRPEYDASLMTKPPSKKTDQQEAEDRLKPYIARGLKVHFDSERWYMRFGKKNDEGTLRMPARVLLRCAERLME